MKKVDGLWLRLPKRPEAVACPQTRMTYDCLVVGAGFSGATVAERLASSGKTVLVVDRRTHIAGNAYDEYDPQSNILIHAYGPHYFRTNSDKVQAYLSRFAEWQPVDYKILSYTEGRYWQFPINLNTFEQILGRPSSSEEMAETLEGWKVPIANPQNSEEVVISQIGVDLYKRFFEEYTLKQWKRHPRNLDPSVCGRIPNRTNRDDRYLTERFQALPVGGYTVLIRKMLSHPNIQILLNADFRSIRAEVRCRHTVYTGPIDEYFDCRLGPLPYRSLRFERETHEREFFQPAMQVNYPNDQDFTRIVEMKHAPGQKSPITTIVKEYPQDFGPGKEPYYPIPAPDTKALYGRYAELAAAEKDITFLGRLATYRYINMDQVVADALSEAEKIASSSICG